MIKGNTEGIKKSALIRLEALIGTTCQGVFDDQRAAEIAALSSAVNREIAVVVTANGRILDIMIGSFDKVNTATNFSRNIAQKGLAVIHTHPGASPALSEADLSLLTGNIKAVAAIGVTKEGKIRGIEAAAKDEGQIVKVRANNFDDGILTQLIKESKDLPKKAAEYTGPEIEKAILVATGSGKKEDFEYNLAELKELCRTAGAQVLDTVIQKKDKPGGAYLLGTGKLNELAILIQSSGANMVIFDNELTGVQVNNLEKTLGVKVIDRSNLILDIFAKRAQSLEGKLQVELAQLKYTLPRLVGFGGSLDRTRGGIGLRGPGEKKLETDRRVIKKRIFELEKRIEKLASEREARRKQRGKNALPTVALVGYTNAGKSTLMNALSKSDVLAEDMLFATLDPVTRKVYAKEGKYYFLTDTVGFINKLPHQFIEAFASTLEEAAQADLLLNVADLSSPYLTTHMEVVRDTLAKIGAGDKPVINVFNKCDLVTDPSLFEGNGNIVISAKNNINIEKLKEEIYKKLFTNC